MILKRPATVIDRNPDAAIYLSVATFIPIARWRHVFSSFRLSNRVEKQLKQTPGIVAYSLAVDLPRRHFWTYTVWSDPAAVPAFTRSEPHATAVKFYRDRGGDGAAFVEWETPYSALDWNDAFERLKQPRFYVKPASPDTG